MAASLRGNGNSGLLSRLKALINFQRLNHTSAEEGLQAKFYQEMGSDFVAPQGSHIDMSKWKKLDSRTLGIDRSMIPPPSWTLLQILRSSGFEAYLVGGCVRDLLLNKIPKDFDVITTAQLQQIKKKFYRSMIVGRRFPICRVHIKGSVIEVSSFDTVAKHAEEKEKEKEKEDVLSLQMPRGCDKKDFIRWRNSIGRDFTINSLFFDPFVNKIYDYTNGMADLRSLKLRTLIPAQLSFKEDCARILRGLRIAARLGLSLSKDTENAMRNLSSSIQGLAKDRIMLELNYMLSYGAAEPSLCLLHRFNLLELVLPFQAAYLKGAGESVKSSIMLMRLFFHLDKLVTCDRPSGCILWIGLLAFHLALVNNPQEALVIWAFASTLYHGNWEKGVKFAKEHAQMHVNFVPEISGSSDLKSDEEIAEGVALLASLVQDSIAVLTDRDSLFESMCRYPTSRSGFVFISKTKGEDVAEIFRVLLKDFESYNCARKNFEIDYHMLGKGSVHESRFVLGKIILETMSSGAVKGGVEVVKVEKTHLQPDVTEESCDLSLSVLVKHQVLKERKDERGLSTSNPELKHEMMKKQKLVEKKSSLSKREVAIMNPKVVERVEYQEMAKKHQKIIETCQSPLEETNMKQGNVFDNQNCHLQEHEVPVEKHEMKKKRKFVEKNSSLSKQEVAIMNPEVVERVGYQEMAKKHQKIIETCQLPQEETNMKQGNVLDDQNCHLQEHEVTGEMQGDVEKDKCKDNSKIHWKVVEKVVCLLSQDNVTKEPKVVGRSKIKPEKVLEKKQLPFSPRVVVREKQDEVVVKEKGSRPLLSSFFK